MVARGGKAGGGAARADGAGRRRARGERAAACVRTWFITWICTLLTVDDTGTTAATGSTGTEASKPETLYSVSCVALNLVALAVNAAATAAFCSVPRSKTTVVARMMTMPMHVVVTAVEARRRVALERGEK